MIGVSGAVAEEVWRQRIDDDQMIGFWGFVDLFGDPSAMSTGNASPGT